MLKVAFLDTNVYLHYQLFDQVNWSEVLKASMEVNMPHLCYRIRLNLTNMK